MRMVCLLGKVLRGLSDRVKLWCPTVFAGAAAPADLAGTDVPAVAEMELSAVAEVHSSAVDAEGVPLVIQESG